MRTATVDIPAKEQTTSHHTSTHHVEMDDGAQSAGAVGHGAGPLDLPGQRLHEGLEAGAPGAWPGVHHGDSIRLRGKGFALEEREYPSQQTPRLGEPPAPTQPILTDEMQAAGLPVVLRKVRVVLCALGRAPAAGRGIAVSLSRRTAEHSPMACRGRQSQLHAVTVLPANWQQGSTPSSRLPPHLSMSHSARIRLAISCARRSSSGS